MSYDIDLVDKTTGEIVQVDNHTEGGTYAIGGTTEASLNATYNYSGLFRFVLDREKGIRWLYGKKGDDVIDRLTHAISVLEDMGGVDQYRDYWAPTPGNAAHALRILLSWAKQYPGATFEGD